MVNPVNRGWARLLGGGVLALAGYGGLAARAELAEARPWLAGALALGWVGLALAAWREVPGRAARWTVVGWAIGFRLVGLGTAPSWEDDYHRYLWDGYQTVTTGNPYAAVPADWFGREATTDLPPAVAAALDGVNHPEIPTIYGPAAQSVFAVAAWLAPGRLAVLKLLLVMVECLGCWSLRHVLSWRGWVLIWWCPLAVTEIAFAGHPEAIGVAALAVALAAWSRGQAGVSALAVAVATATKPLGAVLAPFGVRQFGRRTAGIGLLGWVGCYLPWWLQGSRAEWPALRAMAGNFEYNSTGYALLAALGGAEFARPAAAVATLAGAAGLWMHWRRRAGARPDRGGVVAQDHGLTLMVPVAAAVLGWVLWWSPVVNPWYALWLLPLAAVAPRGWSIGVLLAVPLAYTHGWGDWGGAGVDYTHPVWTRPLEVGVVVATAAIAAALRRREPAHAGSKTV